MLQSLGLQRVRHDLATEQRQTLVGAVFVRPYETSQTQAEVETSGTNPSLFLGPIRPV